MLEGIRNLLRGEESEPGLTTRLFISEPYTKEAKKDALGFPEAIMSPCCGPQGCTPAADPCCGTGCDSNCSCG